MKNLDEAFTFVFKDPNWLTKLLIGGVFTFLSILFIGVPVILGYGIELLQRVRRGEKYPLPEWKDVGVKFILGFKYFITLFVYYLPIMIVMIPVIIFLVIASLNGIERPLESTPVGVLAFLLVMPYVIVIMLITPFIAVEFASHERIRDGLNVARVFNFCKRFWEEAAVVAAISIGLSLTAYLGIIFFIFGIFLTSFFVLCIQFHLYGQIGEAMYELSNVKE